MFQPGIINKFTNTVVNHSVNIYKKKVSTRSCVDVNEILTGFGNSLLDSQHKSLEGHKIDLKGGRRPAIVVGESSINQLIYAMKILVPLTKGKKRGRFEINIAKNKKTNLKFNSKILTSQPMTIPSDYLKDVSVISENSLTNKQFINLQELIGMTLLEKEKDKNESENLNKGYKRGELLCTPDETIGVVISNSSLNSALGIKYVALAILEKQPVDPEIAKPLSISNKQLTSEIYIDRLEIQTYDKIKPLRRYLMKPKSRSKNKTMVSAKSMKVLDKAIKKAFSLESSSKFCGLCNVLLDWESRLK